MVELNCPLCCTETFTSPSSLKCHLLNILEKLLCPVCNLKFDKLEELAEHLDSDCGSNLDEVNHLNESEKSTEEDETGGAVEDSILARALLQSEEVKEEENAAETQYYCQSCDVHLIDINAHLREFHEDQEIVVEDIVVDHSVEPPSVSSKEITYVIVNYSDQSEGEEPEKEEPVIENVKDKDGRLYTRKFVKIDKFWLLESQANETPNDVEEEPKNKDPIQITLCQTCNAYFPNNEPHVCEEKTGKRLHKCETCNTTFPTFKSLRLHRRMHEPIKSREVDAPAESETRQMFVCKICYKTYDKEYEEVHMTSHRANNEYNCEICNRKFFTKLNLEMHVKAHTNRKKFTCSYCKKSFVTYDALNDHLVNQCQKRPYACQYCGRRFTRPHEKVKHERIHTGEKPHICDICGKAFRVSYCLTLHLRTHSGTRPYQCKHCGKKFKSHSVYNHHLLTHSDVRAYKCPYCPKAFKTSVQLAGHKNSHIKPFACTQCNRPFASLYAVRAHMESHKRQNNLKYECYVCGALYSRAFALKDHLKEQHENDPRAKAEVTKIAEEMEATNSIMVNEEDIILGLDASSGIIIENERE